MTGLAITLTNAGLAALTAAKGSNAITIASVGLTAASFTPTADATSLPDQIKTLSTISGEVADAYTVHLSVRDESTDSYTLRGFGLFLSDGTLFGIYGNGDALIMEKAAASILLLAIDIDFSESDATAITFGDTNFTDPPATTERQGVVELATSDETSAGTDASRAVTPKGLLAAVTGWLNARFGDGAPSDYVKGLLTGASASVVRTALELKSAALSEASAFAAAVHGHAISDVTGLQTALDAKLASTGYTAADVLAKLKSVDGAGSGLDADTLDGQHAAHFLQQHDALVSSGSLDSCIVAGSYRLQKGLTNQPTNAEWSQMLVLTGGAGDTITQIVFGRIEQSVWYRTGAGTISDAGTITWTDWATLWTSGNDGSGSGLDADTVDGKEAAAFALAGGANASGTWPISITGTAAGVSASASGTNTVTLVSATMADNDYFRILVGGTASDAGYAEIATSDNGNEPIYVRQYSPSFDTLIRSLTLLDGSGNTSLPGSLSISGNTAWHAGNDGSGSGLDADTVDGYQASSLARITSSSSSSTAGYRVWSDGFIECWGTGTSAANGTSSFTFPLSFTSWSHAMVNGGNYSSSAEDNGPFVYSTSLTGFVTYNGLNTAIAVQWRAWGY